MLTRRTRSRCTALLLTSLLTVAGVAGAAPADAAALSVTPTCESAGAGHFTCFAGVSGGTAPYTYSWQSVTNTVITSNPKSRLIQGLCAVNRFSEAKVTVTDATGATVSGYGPFTCTAIAP